jgi:predicted RNase H-like HicB family nuclease
LLRGSIRILGPNRIRTRGIEAGGVQRRHRLPPAFAVETGARSGAAGYTCRIATKGIRDRYKENAMRLKVVVHEAEEGGFWAEVPAIPGCATEGETFEDLLTNLYEAIEGCLSVDVTHVKTGARDRIMDIAI